MLSRAFLLQQCGVLILTLGGLHEKYALQRGILGYQLNICSRTEGNNGTLHRVLKPEGHLNNRRTEQFSYHTHEIYCVSITLTNQLILFGETIAIYSENHTKSINAFCLQNAEILNVNSKHCSLNLILNIYLTEK
jgi:hypothetical protein